MKLQAAAWLVAFSLTLFQNAFGQAFANLNFEDATIVSDPSSGYYPYAVYADQAIPGWTAVGTPSPNDIMYNDLSLGTPQVCLLGLNDQYGPPPIDGAFSIFLQAFPYGMGNPSISQTGLIPASSKSLLFEAQQSAGGIQTGSLQVSLGGQSLSFFALSTGANYTLYGADISAYAGQTRQLTFLADAIGPGDNFWEIDDIQFSPASVPEPNIFGLLALAGLLLSFRRLK